MPHFKIQIGSLSELRTLDSLIQRGTFWNKKVYCLICHHLTLKLLYYEASCFYEDIGHEGLKLSLPSNHNFRKLAAVGAKIESPALRSEPWQVLIRLRGLPRRRVTCGGNFKARLSSAERASYSSPLAYKEWKNRKDRRKADTNQTITPPAATAGRPRPL